jgi:hypothetical protein
MDWNIDPARADVAFWAAIGAGLVGAVAFVAMVFSVPPPERRQIWRGVIDFLLGTGMGWAMGYALALTIMAMLNGFTAKLLPGFSAFDRSAAGLFVGMVVVKGWPVFFDWLLAWIKRRTEAKTA